MSAPNTFGAQLGLPGAQCTLGAWCRGGACAVSAWHSGGRLAVNFIQSVLVMLSCFHIGWPSNRVL